MKRDYKLYLNDIKESIAKIESYLQNISEEQFKKDMKLALFFTCGMSLEKWAKIGSLSREIKPYQMLAKKFLELKEGKTQMDISEQKKEPAQIEDKKIEDKPAKKSKKKKDE